MNHILLADGSDFELSPALGKPPSIATIAHSLSLLCRFTGHTTRFYSVAEHSLLCFRIAQLAFREPSPGLYACALLHDAAECITGDIATPLKRILGGDWEFFNHRVEQHVWAGINERLPRLMEEHQAKIKQIDLTALWIERRDVMTQGKDNAPWRILDQGNFTPLTTGLFLDEHAFKAPVLTYEEFLRVFQSLRFT